jgi:hypothetical protein
MIVRLESRSGSFTHLTVPYLQYPYPVYTTCHLQDDPMRILVIFVRKVVITSLSRRVFNNEAESAFEAKNNVITWLYQSIDLSPVPIYDTPYQSQVHDQR